MISRTKEIVFEDVGHIYTHVETGSILRSVSAVYREFITPFDAQKISWFVAQKQLRLEISSTWQKGDPQPNDEAITARQVIILAEWDAKRDNAGSYGTAIHKVCEDIMNDTDVDKKYDNLKFQLQAEFGHYHKKLPEFIVYSLKYGVGGQIDNPLVRQRSDKSVIDIDDFKTNVEKGIVFDSTGEDKQTGKIKHYNQFMLSPIDYLEDCNYTHYCMQQSIYAYLVQLMFPTHKIGRITLTFIEEIETDDKFTYKLTRIPIPYLKMEAHAVLEAYNKKHPFKLSEKNSEIPETEYDEDDY
jgi:hypothetical protein